MLLTHIAATVTEFGVFFAFLLVCINARGQGVRWLSSVLWGAAAGFVAEACLVNHDYYYATDLFVFVPWNRHVPLFVGAGWGTVFYISTWTAQRLRLRYCGATALAAGVLGANIDLSIDPVASLNGFWVWSDRTTNPSTSFFHIPFDNFVAWVAFISLYGLFCQLLFRLVNHFRHPTKGADAPTGAPPQPQRIPGFASQATLNWRQSLVDFLTPFFAAVLAGSIFWTIRHFASDIYGWLGQFSSSATSSQPVGEAIVFSVVFLIGLFIFWSHVLRASRAQAVNWVVLWIVVGLHLLSGALFLAGALAFPVALASRVALAIVLPLNFVGGVVAFAWPSIDTLFDIVKWNRATRTLPVSSRLISNYSGDQFVTTVFTPTTLTELEAAVAYARTLGAPFTIRAAGQAFDGQSMNHSLVISLAALGVASPPKGSSPVSAITVSPSNRTVTAPANATWKQVLAETLPKGLVPRIMVTNSAATVGGTLSSHSLSRFTPALGREGEFVQSLQLLTPNGQVLTCSGTSNPSLFAAAIGGLGYAGVILEATYTLEVVSANAVVETTFTEVQGTALVAGGAGALRAMARTIAVRANSITPDALVGHSAFIDMRGGLRGLVATSHYVSPRDLHRSVFHSPHSLAHRILQLLGMIPYLNKLGLWLTFRSFRDVTTTYIDVADDYTFFEDGNRFVRRALRMFGIPARVVQQTFMIKSENTADYVTSLDDFMKQVTDRFVDKHMTPAAIDILYVPRDTKPFTLSSSNGLGGFAVTLTFERLFNLLEKEKVALRALSQWCADSMRGHRVHLVKNVLADSGTLATMYASGISGMNQVRSTAADQLLKNEFSDSTLVGLR